MIKDTVGLAWEFLRFAWVWQMTRLADAGSEFLYRQAGTERGRWLPPSLTMVRYHAFMRLAGLWRLLMAHYLEVGITPTRARPCGCDGED